MIFVFGNDNMEFENSEWIRGVKFEKQTQFWTDFFSKCKVLFMNIWLSPIIEWASHVVLVVKNPPANAGDIRDACLISALGRSPGGGHSNPLQYSCLENPMDRGPWWSTVHGVAKSWTQQRWLSTHAGKLLGSSSNYSKGQRHATQELTSIS